MRFLKLTIMPDREEDIDPILEGLRTTLPEREAIIDEEGDMYLEIHSDEELMAEAFCLGNAYAALEEDGLEDPFFIEVMDLETPPIDSFRVTN